MYAGREETFPHLPFLLQLEFNEGIINTKNSHPFAQPVKPQTMKSGG
jgi:hypothetical protein